MDSSAEEPRDRPSGLPDCILHECSPALSPFLALPLPMPSLRSMVSVSVAALRQLLLATGALPRGANGALRGRSS